MKDWRKFVLGLFILVLISQLPFAYRRYKLGKLHAAIASLSAQRQESEADGWREYVGVSHVHSFLGGHSSGTFQEIVAAAHANNLHFVLMSEHPAKDFNTAEKTLSGVHGGIHFVNGNEVLTATGDRLLIFVGDGQSMDQRATEEVLSLYSARTNFVAYPETFNSWDLSGYQGIEIYNVYTNARDINPLVMFFDGLWSYRSHPDLLFANFYRRPTDNLRHWDGLTAHKGKLAAIAGNDSHANIGFGLQDSAGNTILGLKLDPYERSFRLVRLHVLLPTNEPLNEHTLLGAIANGRCFIGFDIFGDTTGFRFSAVDADETRVMGEEISIGGDVRITVRANAPSRIVLLRDGVAVREEQNTVKLDHVVREKGTYRVEVFRPELPHRVGGEPWIISNPIYVR